MTWDVNSSIVSGWCKPGSDVDDRTSSGKLFQTAVAAGTLKTRDWKMQDWKTWDQIAWVEIAGLENGGPVLQGWKTRDWKTREHNLYGQPDVT